MVVFFRTITIVVLLLTFELAIAQIQILMPGDVVIVGYNFKDPDEFSLLTLVNLQAGTQLYITDAGWDEQTSSFRKGEGLITYTVPSGGISTGQQIVYPYAPGFQTQGMNGFFGLSMAGDQLLVFQGNIASPNFIFGINDFNGNWQSHLDLINNQTSHLPSALVSGYTALAINSFLQARFDCVNLQLDKVSFLKQLSNPANWIKVTDRVDLPLEACNFTSLPLVVIKWDYQFINQEQLLLNVKYANENKQNISWVLEDAELECVFKEDSYTCKLPSFLADQFLLKPCLNTENVTQCGLYRLLQRAPRSIFYFTHTEIGGTIRVIYEEENELEQPGQYYLFDFLGRLIAQDELSNSFTIGNLKQGGYLLKVHSGKSRKELKIWVVN